MAERKSVAIVWHTNSSRIACFTLPQYPGVVFRVSCSYALAAESPALTALAAVRLIIWSEGRDFSTVTPMIDAAARLAAAEPLKAMCEHLQQRHVSSKIAILPAVIMRWCCTPIQTPWQCVSGTASDGEFFARGRICSQQPRNLPVQLKMVISMSRLTRGTMSAIQVIQLITQLREELLTIAGQLRLQGVSVTVCSEPRYVVDDSQEVVRAPEGPSSFAHVRTAPLKRTLEETVSSRAASAMAGRAAALSKHPGVLVRR